MRAENPDDNAGDPYRVETFAYDELGNRKDWNDLGSRGAGTLLAALLLARSVFDGTILGLADRIGVLLFVHAKLGRHTGFFIQHLSDRGRFIPAMFSVSERREGPIEGKREGDRYGDGFLISHAVDAVRVKMTGQENTKVAGSSGTRQLMYCRYPSGEVSRQVYSDGAATVLREYTARGQLRSVSWAGGNASYTYLPDGKVDHEDYGNGLQTKYEYDARGMIYSVRHRNRGRTTIWPPGSIGGTNGTGSRRGSGATTQSQHRGHGR